MTLEEDLVEAVDRAARRLGTTRSAFARQALARAQDGALEERHRAGYAQKPVRRAEFEIWEPEQVWPEL